jgi:AcrR family transcriptional regulator
LTFGSIAAIPPKGIEMTKEESKHGRRRRKDARPAEIIDAGLICFAMNGYAGTKLADVAKRAGVSKGTIYHYFTDKDDLFRAAFRSRFVDSLGDATDMMGAYDGPMTPVLTMALQTAYLQLASSDALGLVKVMLMEGDRFPELARECREELVDKVTGLLRQLIDMGIAQGEFTAGAYRDMPTILLAPGIAFALAASLVTGTAAQEQARAPIEAFMEILLSGIRAR